MYSKQNYFVKLLISANFEMVFTLLISALVAYIHLHHNIIAGEFEFKKKCRGFQKLCHPFMSVQKYIIKNTTEMSEGSVNEETFRMIKNRQFRRHHQMKTFMLTWYQRSYI